MLLCANSMFGQRKNAVSLSLEEIKDMPPKIGLFQTCLYINRCFISSDAMGMLLKTMLTLGIKMH